ncbi:MAG TPA: allantoinase, partial [Firmicutes bacterium]|nr:allantoinase [Bacillota bacterium]
SFMMEQLGSLLKVNPPLRSPGHREALWEALSGGTVEVLASDHAPHTPEEKLKPDIWEAVSGFCGVETLAPLMLTEVNQGTVIYKPVCRTGVREPGPGV